MADAGVWPLQLGPAGAAGPPGVQGPPGPDTQLLIGNLDARVQSMEGGRVGIKVFNVKNPVYGAVGDGIADDTAKIQACVAAANAGRGMVFFPEGRYKITSTIDFGAVTALGVGAINEGAAVGGQSQLIAGTPGMTMVKVGFLGRLRNFAIQGNNTANIGVRVESARPFLENVEVYRCRKSSFVLAKTQNGAFINCFSQYSARGYTFGNGARNNNFYNCTAANYAAFYNAAAIGTPWENTCLIEWVIDEADADYGGPGVTALGNDRNSFFGGIFEAAGVGIRARNLSAFVGAQASNNQFYGAEFTCDSVLDTIGAALGTLTMDSCSFTTKNQDTPWGIGDRNTRVRFSGDGYFSGSNNLQRRGVVQLSNYASLYRIDTDAENPVLALEGGGGGYTWDETTREITLTGGNAVQGALVQPGGYGNVCNSATVAKLAVPGASVLVTFTIKSIGANPVLVYIPIVGAPWRRQVGSYALVGTYQIAVRIGDNANDQFAVSFANNNNAANSTVIKGVTMRATS